MTLANGIRRLRGALGRHGPGEMVAILLGAVRARGLGGVLQMARGDLPFLSVVDRREARKAKRQAWPPELDGDGAVPRASWERWLAARPGPEAPAPPANLVFLVAGGTADPAGFQRTRDAILAIRPGAVVLAEGGASPSAHLYVLLRPGDRPERDLLPVLDAAAADPDVEILTFDLVRELADRVQPLFLPGANPVLAAEHPEAYACAAVRPAVLDEIAPGPVGQRIAAWAGALPSAAVRRRWRHVGQALVRTGPGPPPGPLPPTRRRLPAPAREGASAVICTRDKGHLTRQLVRQLLQLPSDQLAEVVIVANGTANPHALRTLEDAARHPRVRVVRADIPFNFSQLCNAGVRESRGRGPLLFLNDDIAPVSDDWLDAMLTSLEEPGVGSVGTLLLYPNEQVQHAGMYLRPSGAGHYLRGAALPGEDPLGLAARAREVSCLTGAVLLTRREAFDQVGGFDEALAISFQDVDYGLKLHAAGLRNVFEPRAVLIHMESVSLHNAGVDPDLLHRRHAERALIQQRWPAFLARDPFLPAGLDPEDERLRRLAPP